ncbi:hypothetical protein [Paraburkholderia aspalathi]|uniref:Uncharacterized protein n=1 Tax=Paraburkholderia aspalathi TaxID=1324617 RepID=A0A1I7EJJ2_9BURK|nr:hypothetical protein [Paraburkholderia aspalathi]SFU24072.1 hypothetical protein SAMN05192563_1024142 [Paraburkholderia aspalathi]
MKHCLIAWLTILATSIAGSAVHACPEDGVDVAMVNHLDAGSTILAKGLTVQRGALAHVTYVPSSPTRVWSFYPALPNADGRRDERRTRLRGDSFEWPQHDDGK